MKFHNQNILTQVNKFLLKSKSVKENYEKNLDFNHAINSSIYN